jgi:hypothetical protein
MSHEKFLSCIDACLECATECDHCATECLNEKDVTMLARCIQLDRECAEACYATARLLGIGGEHAATLCHVCAEICEACAEECERHAELGMDHCRRCAETCRSCADECRAMSGVNA